MAARKASSSAAVAGGAGGRFPASTSFVFCLLSATLGWSNALMPMIAPATAVANSQRKNSCPRSYRSSSASRTTGWPAAMRAWSRGSVASFSPSSPASVRATKRRSRPYTSGGPSGSSATGRIPFPSLPVLSAINCSTHSPKLPNPRGASLGHAMRPVQQLAHVDADQGRRDEPEIGQGGIATADVLGVQERATKSSLPGEPSERCVGVGNGDELRAPAARLLPEVAVQAVGLLRRPGLARNEEQRARDVLASERGDHRTRVGDVDHRERRVARLAAERVPQHLGRQARAPHAAQDHAIELAPSLPGERVQRLDLLSHHLAHVEPTQPVADLGCRGVSLTDSRVAAPNT